MCGGKALKAFTVGWQKCLGVGVPKYFMKVRWQKTLCVGWKKWGGAGKVAKIWGTVGKFGWWGIEWQKNWSGRQNFSHVMRDDESPK